MWIRAGFLVLGSIASDLNLFFLDLLKKYIPNYKRMSGELNEELQNEA